LAERENFFIISAVPTMQLHCTHHRRVATLLAQKVSPHCDAALAAEDQADFSAYDHIERPLIAPVVTRVSECLKL
jgi:hypothetical protein